MQKRRREGNGLRFRKRKLAAPQRVAKRNGTASLAGMFVRKQAVSEGTCLIFIEVATV